MFSKVWTRVSAKVRSSVTQVTQVMQPATPAFSFSGYLHERLVVEPSNGARREDFAPSAQRNGAAQNALLPVSFIHRWRTRVLQNPRVDTISKILVSPQGRSEAEQEAVDQLKLVSLGAGLGVASFLFFPLLLAGVVCLFPTIGEFFKSGYRHLREEKRISSDVLSSVLIAGALAGGFIYVLLLAAWALAFIKWLAIKTEDHSKQEIIDLFDRRTRTVWMLIDGVEVEVPLAQAQVGDQIQIHAGQMVPVDGIIVKGYASLDQHMLTGEAQPAEKGPGDRVLAATVLLAGNICVRVEKAGEATAAAEIGRILTDTSNFKDGLVSRANAFNDRMALPFLLLSGVSLPLLGVSGALAILQITPGYRMVLFGPISMLSFLHLAASAGILIKDGRSLELLRDVDTVLFDKTGTLTLEQLHLEAVYACPGFSEEEVLALAAAAETKQSHPIARAILQAASAWGIETGTVDNIAYELGLGIKIKLDRRTVRVGSARFLRMHGIVLPAEVETLQDRVHTDANSLVLVAVNEEVAGGIVLQPTIRPEARTIVNELRARGMKLYIVSGDHETPTRRLAEELKMDGYFAAVLPEGKARLVRQLQEMGRKVCFVGDGINDSIALKGANVSVSMRDATTIATDAAQIVLMDGDLRQLPQVFVLADEFAANMRVNFRAATWPSYAILGGIFLLGWGLPLSMVLYQVSLPFALHNTLRPLLAAEKRKLENTSALTPIPENKPDLLMLESGDGALPMMA